MLADIRYAIRACARQRSFAAAAIATLTLGIAVNTVAFSLLNAFVLRPMPVPAADRVVRLYPVDAAGRRANLFSLPDYRDYRDQSRDLFETLAGYIPADLTAGRSTLDRAAATPRAALGYFVSASYFDLTGVRPVLGRTLQPQDDVGDSRSVVLGHAFWQRRFGGDPRVIGSTLVLNGQPSTVVGVAEPRFAGTEPLVADVWAPLSALQLGLPRGASADDRATASLLMAGRLRHGVSRARAGGAASVIARRLAAVYPRRDAPAGVQLASGTFFTLDPGIKPVIAGVMAVVGLVLLIACANVANLILARAASRRREIAVRLALGASRSRIVRQLMIEALLLSTVAGAAALLVSTWTLRILYGAGLALAPFSWSIVLTLQPDVRVFAYTFGLAALGGAALGLIPALQSVSPRIASAFRGERVAGGRLRHALVVLQVAGSLVLLFAAGLLARGLQRAESLDLGFTARGMFYGEYDLRAQGYDAARAAAFHDALIGRIGAVPGVTSAALTSHVPLHGGVRRISVTRPGGTSPADAAATIVSTVSPEYFATLGVAFVTGRNFDAGRDDAPAVVIGEGLARRFWPGESAVGKAVASSAWPAPRTIVGVVRDASNAAIWRDKEMSLYVPVEPSTDPRDVRVIVRGSAGAGAALESIALSLDADLRFEAAPVDALLQLWLLPSRAAAAAAGTLAALAVLLASIGLYGVLSFTVSQRLREIGVRMALGADAPIVIRLVLRDGLRLIVMGLMLGSAVAGLTAPLLGRLLFGVSAFDPAVALTVPLLLTAIGLMASYVPARRAARLEPLSVLRAE